MLDLRLKNLWPHRTNTSWGKNEIYTVSDLYYLDVLSRNKVCHSLSYVKEQFIMITKLYENVMSEDIDHLM